jgi:hypothetical protein
MAYASCQSMPSPAEILSGLTKTANDWLGVAFALHVALAGLLCALAVPGARPSNRTLAMLATLPVLSVSAFAWLAGNPFNGGVFALGAGTLAALALRIEPTPLRPAPRTLRWIGAAMLAFGWFYPHFLVAHPWWFYAFAAPFGLVPCPTLSVVLGLSLYFSGFGSRAWSATLGALGLFYGVVGVFRLGVWIDLPLAAAAVVSLLMGLRRGLGVAARAVRPA